MAVFLIMMYGCRKRQEQCDLFPWRCLRVSVMMVGFGAMLIPSWLFCNNSAWVVEGAGVVVAEGAG